MNRPKLHPMFWVRISLPLFAIVGVLWVIVVLVDSSNTRYQALPYIYRQIFGNQGQIDLVTGGPSRTASMVNSKILGERLSARLSRKVVVVDLARPWVGLGLEYVILRDLLENRPVLNIALGLGFRSWDRRPSGNPWFYRVATLGDVMESNLARAELPVWRRLQLGFRESIRKIAMDFGRLIQGRIYDLALNTSAVSSIVQEFEPTERSPEGTSILLPLLSNGWPPEYRTLNLNSPADARFRHYLRKIVDLARQYNTKLILFHPADAYASPKLLSQLREHYGVPLIQMGKDEWRSLNPRGFVAPGHASRYGQGIWSRWLAEHLPVER